MRHVIAILIENEAGSLSRVAGLFSARGYNIESLTVAATEDDSLSRMTIITRGADNIIEQIVKQLNKLVDVVKVMDLTEGEHIGRELLLLKIDVSDTQACHEVKRVTDIFRGHIIDVHKDSYIIEMTGGTDKINAFLDALDSTLIMETVRSGVSGIGRGGRSL